MNNFWFECIYDYIIYYILNYLLFLYFHLVLVIFFMLLKFEVFFSLASCGHFHL